MEGIDYSKMNIPGYYTPEPSEFHEGFEYEKIESIVYKNNRWGFPVKSQVFTKKHWTNKGTNYNFFEDIKEGRIRVKKLNKDDIESLGFIEVSKDWYHEHAKSIGTNNGYQISASSIEDMYEISFGVHEHSKILFKGIIKNKSELIKILKQVGYESKSN